jgi:aminoglycoside 2'-N-acetyltransferase I
MARRGDGASDPERGPLPHLRRLPTDGLSDDETRQIRGLLAAAFGSSEEDRFEEGDWLHALGGCHVILELEGRIVSHAAVVPRVLHVGGRPLRTGYVEAVATVPGEQGRGLGSMLMRDVGDHIRERYELGALGTGRHRFYERLGWLTWRGPSSVRAPDGERPTPEEDGYILVLPTPTSPALDPGAPISCDWRAGDVW